VHAPEIVARRSGLFDTTLAELAKRGVQGTSKIEPIGGVWGTARGVSRLELGLSIPRAASILRRVCKGDPS